MADTTKLGAAKESDKIYLSAQADAKIDAAVKQEGYNREAMINAKLSHFEVDVVNPKINALRSELSLSSSGNGSGIRYMGSVESYAELGMIINPQHGDMYLLMGSDDGVAYVCTFPQAGSTDVNPTWVTTHIKVDLTNYITRDETCSLNDFQTTESNALDTKNRLNAAMLQLQAIKDKTAIPNTEKTLENVNTLLGELVTALSAAVKAYNGQL